MLGKGAAKGTSLLYAFKGENVRSSTRIQHSRNHIHSQLIDTKRYMVHLQLGYVNEENRGFTNTQHHRPYTEL